MGQWYSVTFKYHNHIYTLKDSLKLLPFKLREIGESFKTKHQKLDMEYEGQRYAGCLITQEEMIKVKLGSLEDCNHRVINKMIVRDNVETCQLQMGMTELKPGSVWNTMPAHVHDRRMEAYYYFEIPENQTICHFLGEPQETRHLFMHNEQAVLSPEWSIHSAAATHNYTFIWGMGGENLDYGDVDQIEITALR
jgi:4-deoxy-L-threo-5-hexosulose-uronate ketol-isomerase